MRTTKLTVAALAVCLLTACTPNQTESPTPTPTDTTTTADPTPTPTQSPSPSRSPSPSPTAVDSFPTPAATVGEEELAIRQALIDYYAVLDKFGGDAALTDLTETQYVTTGEASAVIIQEITQLRENGHIAVGGRSFYDLAVATPETNSEGVTISTIAYCEDRTQLRILEAETREDTGLRPAQFLDTVATLELGSDQTWRVAMMRNQEVESC